MSEPTFYQHTARPQWGLCIFAAQSESGRRYQFEDGKLRTIAPGYIDRFMEKVESPDDATTRFGDLTRKLGRTPDGLIPRKATQTLTFEEQVEHFKDDFPKAFRDTKWLREVRGLDASRKLKRHRDPAIQFVQKALNRERMIELLQQGRATELWMGLVDALGKTDLVNKSREVDALKRVRVEAHAEICQRLFELLHAEELSAPRFDRFVAALRMAGVKPTWPLVTAPLALFAPTFHAYVRPAIIRRQAKSAAPNLKVDRSPIGRSYLEIREMVEGIQRDLERQELKPRGLIDVFDFIHRTTKPESRDAAEVADERKAA